MTTLIRAAVTVAIVAAALLSWAAPASACTCLSATAADHFDAADAVFTGTVVSAETFPWREGAFEEPVQMSVEVAKVFKGAVYETQSLVTTTPTGGCGIGEIRGEVLVYAFESDPWRLGVPDGELVTTLCSGTRTSAVGPGLGNAVEPLAGVSPAGEYSLAEPAEVSDTTVPPSAVSVPKIAASDPEVAGSDPEEPADGGEDDGFPLAATAGSTLLIVTVAAAALVVTGRNAK